MTIGGVAVPAQEMWYVGIPSWSVGTLQINFTVPPNAPLGLQPVVVTVGSAASAAAAFTVSSSRQVLDEQHLVAALVVDQLIHQVAGHEDAETAGALSALGANLDVLDGRIVRIGNGRVRQQVHREAFAGVLNPHNQGARRAHQRNAHALPGVGAAAVLDGIQEQLAEGRRYVLARLGREAGLHLAQEMRHALDGLQLAAHIQRDPIRARRDHLDIVPPGRRLQGLLHHVGQRSFRQRLMEVAVGALPNGADDPRRVLLPGEDHLGFGANFAHAPQQLETVESVAALARHHQVVGRTAHAVQGLPPVVDILNAAVLALQEAGEEVVNVGVRVDQQANGAKNSQHLHFLV